MGLQSFRSPTSIDHNLRCSGDYVDVCGRPLFTNLVTIIVVLLILVKVPVELYCYHLPKSCSLLKTRLLYVDYSVDIKISNK